MLVPTPGLAKFVHQGWALAPADVDEARRLGRLVAASGAMAASREIGRWMTQATPSRHDRRTPLDPRVAEALDRLRATRLPEGDAESRRDEVLATWSPAPREVWRAAERQIVLCARRIARFVELDVPSLFVEVELDAMARAIAGLDGEARTLDAAPEDDPGDLVELPYAIVRHARLDLSFGTHLETFRALRAVGGGSGGSDWPEHDLSVGEPLVPFELLDARARSGDGGDAITMGHLRFWKIDVAAGLGECAIALSTTLGLVSAEEREAARRHLDELEPPLVSGDYVAAAEARLCEIAEDARRADRDGLVVVSEISRDERY